MVWLDWVLGCGMFYVVFYVVLYCIVLYCVVLCCVVLCRDVSCRLMLCCIVLCCIALHCVVLCCVVSYRVVSCRALCCVVSCSFVPLRIWKIGNQAVSRGVPRWLALPHSSVPSLHLSASFLSFTLQHLVSLFLVAERLRPDAHVS